jgi:hypothetical protein
VIRGALSLGFVGLLLASCGLPTAVAPELPELTRLRTGALARWYAASGVDVWHRTRDCTLNWGSQLCHEGNWACTITAWSAAGTRSSCSIYLGFEIPTTRRETVLAHELGHAMGLGHVAYGCGLMAPRNAYCLSNVDLEMLCGVGGCPWERPECEVSCE